uniref:Auxin influx carrier-like protein 2 n=1 Tax=Momordica charantia TaxID=3673 RepID=Q2UZS5_MOMCH|nr:auxin influx carrier-like protein 2 [Momordica charantia]
MLAQKQAEEAIVPTAGTEAEHVGAKEEGEEADGGEQPQNSVFQMKNLLWHGGSAWDAWFSCASNQVAQVLLTLPYSFSQLGMLSGILFQIFYGLIGSWTAYLISVLYIEYRSRRERENVSFKNHVIQWFEVLDGLLGPHWKAVGLAFNCTFLLFGSVIQLIGCASNIYYINDHLDKRTWTYIFGACCATTVFIPSFHNYRIWSFLGLGMTTYTAWYMAVAALIHGQVEGVTHSGPTKLVLYFTGATNILYTFGGHAVTVEIMHAMWKPQKFKSIYLMATLYVFTLTLPSASAVYWAFGDELLNHSNAFSLLPKNSFRDAAVILMLIHQFITFGFACTPLYFVWEYMAVAALIHGQVEGVTHSGPTKLVLYFTGATNILYTFGGHAVTVEIMHAMWKPQKFKSIYLMATLYVFTLTLPSASAVYWAFGDELLNHSNAFSLLPKNSFRDAAVILMLIHQFITFGFACTPLYFVWEKVIGMHDTKSLCLRALVRLPVVIPIWFLAIIFPFFGPINSAVGALLVSFTVYIIPSAAHMLTYRKASARQNAAEKPPFFLPSWTAMYVVNCFIVVWILVVGFGFGGWASVTNFVRQIDSFGLFAKCYQCKPSVAPPPTHRH